MLFVFSCALLTFVVLVFIFFALIVFFLKKLSWLLFSHCVCFSHWCYYFCIRTHIRVDLPTFHYNYFHVNHVTFLVMLILPLFSHCVLVRLLFSHWCLALITLVCYSSHIICHSSHTDVQLFLCWSIVHFAQMFNPFYVGVMAIFALVLSVLWCLCYPFHACDVVPLTLVLPLLSCQCYHSSCASVVAHFALVFPSFLCWCLVLHTLVHTLFARVFNSSNVGVTTFLTLVLLLLC